MPGYEPFLLCDFHVHTRWSDGRLTMREVVDLYGQTGRFDVIAITDHILMKRDCWRGPARMASLGRRRFSVTEERFDAYLDDIAAEAQRAQTPLRACWCIPGAEITQNHIRSRRRTRTSSRSTSREYISADQPADDDPPGDPPAGRAQHRVPSASSHDAADRDQHLLSVGSPRSELVDLVDVWEAANRDDLFSVTSLKHYPYVANSDFHKPKHLYSWKTLVRSRKDWPSLKVALRNNVNLAITLYREETWVQSRARARG